MSEDSAHNESIRLDADAVTLPDIITTILVQAHIQDMAPLMVLSTPAAVQDDPAVTNQALFGLENQELAPVLEKPAGNASADTKRQYARQEQLKRSMITAILQRLKTHLPYLYDEVLTSCGGPRKVFTLTLPQIMNILFSEQAESAEIREQDLVIKIRDTTLKLDEAFPFRHYSSLMRGWINELQDMGYVHPPSELLRIIQACMKPYAAMSQPLAAQLDAYAALPHANRTGAGLLAHLVKYERERASQGLTVMEAATSGQQFAGKAIATGGDPFAQAAALYKTSLSAEQRSIMDKYMAAAVETVTFAATHPGQVRMLAQKHCPLHAFQPSHDEPTCIALHDPAAAKRIADEKRAKMQKRAADKKA